jgi:hypothetical protein
MADAEPHPVPAAFTQALRELGLCADEVLLGLPLTGGVSSDIWRIDTAQGPVCAKRALAKLRVAADWRAPIERNQYEARWMQVAQAAQPGCAPQVLGQHPGLGVLVMQWLPPADHRLWRRCCAMGKLTRPRRKPWAERWRSSTRTPPRELPNWRPASTPTRPSSTSGSSRISWPRRGATPIWPNACTC